MSYFHFVNHINAYLQSTRYIDSNNFKSISLTCPITGLKILQPVCVESKWYEYIAAKEKIES